MCSEHERKGLLRLEETLASTRYMEHFLYSPRTTPLPEALVTTPPRDPKPGTRWSLARQLPLLTAAVIIVVVALCLTLTYRALVDARTESLHARMRGVLQTIAQAAAVATKQRLILVRSVAADTAVTRALDAPAPAGEVKVNPAVIAALNKLALPADSGLPIELWTADGRRIAAVGTNIFRDSISTLRPELRSTRGTRVSDSPSPLTGADSVQFGELYQAEGHVLFWVIAPVLRDGKRVGLVAQQRRVNATPTIGKTLHDLSGEDFKLYFRNRLDSFSSSADGLPVAAITRHDSTDKGYMVWRADGSRSIGMETAIPGGPYFVALETARSAVVTDARATLRRIGLLCLLLLAAAIAITSLLSRRITRPLGDLAHASEAIAHGDYARRVSTDGALSDEVVRLGLSFNRMASEVEASQNELASQVEEALAVSEELEHTNSQLQETSLEAEEARDAALQANQAKSDFLAVMSHELRTPLNAIGGYTEILKLGIYGPVNEPQSDALSRIARSQQTLLSLINDVLNFAKLEAGQVHYTITDVPLRSALSSLEGLVAPQLRDRSITYTVHECPREVTVRADADKLQQILINLLSNAIKYSQDGGRIDVLCEVEATQATVHVHDTGIGIAPDRIDKIFDPFIQVGRALNRPHEGVGLGLSISRDLAIAMNGALSVQSELGKGSTFTLCMNRGEDTAAGS